MLAPGEGRPVLRAALAGFLLWCGYGMLRPLRDEIAATRDETDLLWTGTFFAALLAVPFYGRLAARGAPRRTVTGTYRFLALALIVFWALIRFLNPESVGRVWTDRSFYVFVSIYNLFAISLIWSLAAETFRSEQGQRVFGLVAAGISLGAVAGSAITAFLVEHVGTAPLVLAAAATLECALRVARELVPQQRAASLDAGPRDPWWRGLGALFADRYLRTITIYLLLFLVGSGFLYMLKTGLVRAAFDERAARGAFLARVDLITNSATLLLQVFVTGRILPRFGVGDRCGAGADDGGRGRSDAPRQRVRDEQARARGVVHGRRPPCALPVQAVDGHADLPRG
jgi:AAA family ATP:ADP antiporter